MNTVREESVIFNELVELCSRPGYVHIIAFFCFRDNTASISEELTTETIIKQHNPESLICTEISTLVGLLVKNRIDVILPMQDVIQSMINQTEALLGELHHCLSWPMRSHIENIASIQDVDPFSHGSLLREPIFYGGESAYDFQYLDFSRQKYAEDKEWLVTNKGFGIDDAENVIRNIIEIHQFKMLSHLESLGNAHPDNWTMLPAFIFTLNELISRVSIDLQVINNVLSAFCLSEENRSKEFTALNDFNITNACPLISLGNNQYLLFQHYSLVEALYESPYYWMREDKEYLPIAERNKGDFVEKFSAEK